MWKKVTTSSGSSAFQGRMTPRLRDLLLADLSELFDLSKLSYLIHRETYFILADVIRSRITPKPGRKSIYIIKADYAYKVYEITAKAIPDRLS
ncbi:MAG TPA: hypothetical protein ENG66_07760 [Thermococcus sp.]|nr:hypothetical protein [Thermococcus sp.]